MGADLYPSNDLYPNNDLYHNNDLYPNNDLNHTCAPENISGHFGLLFLRAPYKFQFYFTYLLIVPQYIYRQTMVYKLILHDYLKYVKFCRIYKNKTQLIIPVLPTDVINARSG